MKKFLYLLTLTMLSVSCAKVEKTFTWTGEREVGAEGGTIVWTPNVEDPHHWPEITAIVVRVDDVSKNEIIESLLFEKPGLTIEGEWYKVTGKLNQIIIEFEPNTTPYSRSIAVSLDNPPGGYGFSVSQKKELKTNE